MMLFINYSSNTFLWLCVMLAMSEFFLALEVEGVKLSATRLFSDWYIFTSSVSWSKPRDTYFLLLGCAFLYALILVPYEIGFVHGPWTLPWTTINIDSWWKSNINKTKSIFQPIRIIDNILIYNIHTQYILVYA